MIHHMRTEMRQSLDSITSVDCISKILNHLLTSVAERTGLSLTLSRTS